LRVSSTHPALVDRLPNTAPPLTQDETVLFAERPDFRKLLIGGFILAHEETMGDEGMT